MVYEHVPPADDPTEDSTKDPATEPAEDKTADEDGEEDAGDFVSYHLPQPPYLKALLKEAEERRAVNTQAMSRMAATGEFDSVLAMVRIPVDSATLAKVLDAFTEEYPHAEVHLRGHFVAVIYTGLNPLEKPYELPPQFMSR